MTKSLLICFCVLAIACSPFRRTTFTYTDNGQTFTHPVIVPRGYRKVSNHTDSAGNTVQAYDYRNKASYYIAYVKDTNRFVQPLVLSENLPRKYINSEAWMYKGLDPSFLYWKEVHRQHLRAGYVNVGADKEAAFDSASTYVAVMPLK